MKSLVRVLCLGIVLTGSGGRADETPVSGVFVCFSGKGDTVGRVALRCTGSTEDGTTNTYKIVKTVDQQVEVGVGFLNGNVLTAGWPSGIGRYQLDETSPDRPTFNGWSMKSGNPAKVFDHSLIFMRQIRDDEYLKGDVVAVDYEEDDYWYYARIEEKTDKGFRVSYLAGDGEADVAVKNLKRYEIRVGDIIVTTARDGLDYFAQVVAVSGTSSWVSEQDTVTLNYLADDDSLTNQIETRNIRYVRFEPRSDTDEGDGRSDERAEETTEESTGDSTESGSESSPSE